MTTDISRKSFDHRKNYSGLISEQGRVQLDSDWNEATAITDRRWRAETLDIFGRCRVPRETPEAFRIAIDAGNLSIGLGRMYVDGHLAENHGEPTDRFDSALAELTGSAELPFDPGGIRSNRGSTIEINDSIVDATASTSIAFGPLQGDEPPPPDNDIPGGILEIINSTVIGTVFAAAIPLASNVIFFSEASTEDEAPVRAADKQTGCVRFSYVPPGSLVPRRYRCQPDLAVRDAIASIETKQGAPIGAQQRENISNGIRARIRPGFNDFRYGRPAYCQLRLSTPIEIRAGADDESEMGGFHQLYQLQRETNLRIRLDEYLRFGLEAGFFYQT